MKFFKIHCCICQIFELKMMPFIFSMLWATRTTTSLGICRITSPVSELRTVTTGPPTASSMWKPSPRLLLLSCWLSMLTASCKFCLISAQRKKSTLTGLKTKLIMPKIVLSLWSSMRMLWKRPRLKSLQKRKKATGFLRRRLSKGLGCKSQANPELEAYLSKANTDCADWLACANIAVAACVIICALAKLVLSFA